MEDKIPQVPKRFIEDNTVKNMKVGDIGYIPLWGGVQLDINQKLWVYAQATIFKKPPKNEHPLLGGSDNEEIQHILSFDPTRPGLKIERLADGYKIHLYEYFEFLREKRFNCEKFSACESEPEQGCRCKGFIRKNLLKTGKLHAESEFIPITAFDDPAKNLNNPVYINSLTPELLVSMTDHELQILLVNSTEDENYMIARIITREIEHRKKK